MRGAAALGLCLAWAVVGCTLDAAGEDAAAAGSGAAGASTSGDASGAGGAAGSCTPGTTQPCYPGETGTRDVGACKAGQQECSAAGSWGTCDGAVPPAVEVCGTAADESCDGIAACTGAVTTAILLGDSSLIGGHALTTDAAGEVLLAAGLEGTFSIGSGVTTSGGLDVVLVRFDAAGRIGLAKAFGDASLQTAHGAAIDSAGNLIVGGALAGQLDFGGAPMVNDGDDTTQDAFVAKLDPIGARLWSHDWGDADDQDVFDVAVDGTDHIAVVGKMRGTLDMGQGAMTAIEDDMFVARLDPAGETLWSKSIGGAGRQTAFAVATADSGDMVIVGEFADAVDFGGGALTAQLLDAFVLRLTAAGAHVYSRGFGGTVDDTAVAVAVDAEDNAIVVGDVRGTADFGCGALDAPNVDPDVFVAKYDAAGNCLWAHRYGDTSAQTGKGVVVDAAGQIVVTGSFAGVMAAGGFSLSSAGGDDVFLLKLDGAGEVIWAQRFGDQNPEQHGLAVSRGPLGGVWVYGAFDGTLPLGATAGTLTATNGADPSLFFVSP